ncbi:hypothetical protein GPA27_13110 [Aromatoleum toluolicum]|uniref:Uncharacterized protein n=1 Tax=Aromatoleum toluolicum TaxID=90060 RepID=A0ABX1NG92_9RHOO|nr:hypothetical protein [Aromatoleum toluolicum]NMF98323.1 hypothetical protein [Aromatoleum toluolicum]
MTKKRSTALDAEAEKRKLADVATRADAMGALAGFRFTDVLGDVDPSSLIAVMGEKIDATADGDMREPERMLMGQAVALQAMFTGLANRAALNMGKHLSATEAYLKLALRAQSQCRATLETLATMKNPPLVIAKQANVTTGPQQINNGMTAPPRAGEIESEPNKLLNDSPVLAEAVLPK